VKVGWSIDDRKFYLGWVQDLMSKSGGNMYISYIQKIRETAIANVPEKEKLALQYLMGEVKTIDLSKLPKPKGPAVPWTVESALQMLNSEPLTGRNLANGKKMFKAGFCVACHRFGPEGGGVGPDLTNLAKRSDFKSIVESILDPNLVVSDQFEQHEIKMKDGTTVLGRIVSEQDGVTSLVQSGFEPNKLTKLNTSDVVSKKASKLSMMPPALINTMNAEEVRDLIAYFVSQGNPKHSVYKKSKKPKLSRKKMDIELVSAVYGVANDAKKQMDVSKQVRRSIDLRDYDFEMTNDLAGRDPAPGIVKVLIIKYKLDGKTYTKTVKENNSVPWGE